MAPRWQPGEEYNYGDIVEYEGKQFLSPFQLHLIQIADDLGTEYKIIQPHRSQVSLPKSSDSTLTRNRAIGHPR